MSGERWSQPVEILNIYQYTYVIHEHILITISLHSKCRIVVVTFVFCIVDFEFELQPVDFGPEVVFEWRQVEPASGNSCAPPSSADHQ